MMPPPTENAGSVSPTCEIITIGSELLLGQITDTNTTHLARELSRIGVSVRFRTAAGDRLGDMEPVLREAVMRCDMVITTGGLGPTEDDLTRQAVANVAGVELEFRQELMVQIEKFFRRLGYEMPENNRRQAFIPKGSVSIDNPVGTAPAFMTEVQGRPIICLPGVPRELKYLLQHQVLSLIKKRLHLINQVVMHRVLKVVGTGESAVDKTIGDLISQSKNPEVGLLASVGEISIRLTARAGDSAEALSMIRPLENPIRFRLGKKIYGHDEDTLEKVIESLLVHRDRSLAIFETFTGGLAALRLHQLPSDRLIFSQVMPDKKRLAEWMGKEEVQINSETTRSLALRAKTLSGASIGLASVGFAEKEEEGYMMKGQVAAVGEGIEKEFSWRMGRDLLSLQRWGAVICLNTLRLALLEAGQSSSL
jgi:nicotinamide-nucleotide amidase